MGMGMLGAMAGAGQAIEGVGKQMFHASLEQDRQNFLIEKQRMLAIESENRQVARINQDRTDRLGRVEGAKNGLLNNAISGKYGQSDMAVADAAAGNTDMPLSSEQLSVIDQAKGADRSKLSNMRGIDAAAAMKAGEYDLATKLKTIDRQEEATEQTLALRRELADTNARLKERDIARKESYTDARIASGFGRSGSGGSRSGSEGGSGSRSGGGKPADVDKIVTAMYKEYGDEFEYDKDANRPADLEGKRAVKRLMSFGLAAGLSPDDAALESVKKVRAAREAATENGVLNNRKYESVLKELFSPKMRKDVLGDEAVNQEEYLRDAYKFEQEKADDAPKDSAPTKSGRGMISNGSKPTADIYKDVGPNNPRMAAMPVVPLAQMLDVVRGKKNHEAIGKKFDSLSDDLLEYISRGEK